MRSDGVMWSDGRLQDAARLGLGLGCVDERRRCCARHRRLLLRTELSDFLLMSFLEKGPSLQTASKSSFLLHLLFGTIKAKREGESQIVSFLSGICPVSVTIVIAFPDFFLRIGPPMEKLKMGPAKFPINRTLIHLNTKPREREQYMHSSQWS